MLDILCDFLLIKKELSGGVELPSDANTNTMTTSASSVSAMSQKAPEQQSMPKRVGSVMQQKKASAAVVVGKSNPTNWFGDAAEGLNESRLDENDGAEEIKP